MHYLAKVGAPLSKVVASAPRYTILKAKAPRTENLAASFDRIRRRRNLDPRIKEYNRSGTSWKQEWYARGRRETVDARPFIGTS